MAVGLVVIDMCLEIKANCEFLKGLIACQVMVLIWDQIAGLLVLGL